jgi:RimJ/RimL family protein N-acetyltransferase
MASNPSILRDANRSMNLEVREMTLEEVELVIDYFHDAAPEFLENMGVDPSRLPGRAEWRQLFEQDYARPIEQRRSFLILWSMEHAPIGFSTVDLLKYGQQARMHLHVFRPELRHSGFGTACVRQSLAIYFDVLKLERLICEPNAFNTAPNRTLQKAGFRYVKTYMTVPGRINFHQPVTQWVIERDGF